MEPTGKRPDPLRAYKDADSTPFNSYIKSQNLSLNFQAIIAALTAPETSWKTQYYIKNLMLNAQKNQKKFKLLCIKSGYITSDGDWKLPKFCEIDRLNTTFPTYQGVTFYSQNLIEKMHSIDSPPNETIINELFSIALRMSIPWHFPKTCSQGNAYLLYNTYVAMGISSTWMKKYYCFGNLDRPTHNKEYHTALSIQDNLGKFWIMDPSVAKKPLLLFRWAALFVEKILLPIRTLFPCVQRRQKNFIFQVEGNDLLTFKKHFEGGTYKICKESAIKNVSFFAAQYTSRTIKHTPLANVMKYPSEKNFTRHNEALGKIMCFIKNRISILPLREDIQSIQPELIFKRRKILHIALDERYTSKFKAIVISKKSSEIVSTAQLIRKLLFMCLAKIETIEEFPGDQKKMLSFWINKKITSFNFFSFSFNSFIKSTLENLPEKTAKG